MPSDHASVPAEERLFSLVLALLASGIGLTKSDIMETVRGYKEQYELGQKNSALDRLFERDKGLLRELGVAIETMDSPEEPGNNQATRYRIPRANFELPPDVVFSREDSHLLALAARVWREGSLSADARRALFKLDGLGVGEPDGVIGYAPRLRPAEPAFGPLDQAISESRQVSFDYLRPGDDVATRRTVLPLALVLYEGRWHLEAWQAEAEQHRTYLLRRIVGPVALGPVVDPLPGDHGAAALAALDALAETQRALLTVAEGSDAALRLSRRAHAIPAANGTLDLGYVDLAILADELAGFGPEVTVIAPQELRDAVRERLQQVAAAHG